MKILSSLFFLLPLVAMTTEVFVVSFLPPTIPTSWKASSTLFETTKSSINDGVLAKLQHEYKELQERLLSDIVVKHDEQDAELVEEQLIEIATISTIIQEDQQLEKIHDADHELQLAEDARKNAQALHSAPLSHNDPDIEWEMENAYEDLVRFSDFKELEATQKKEAAQILLDELKENEQRLKNILKTLDTKKEERDHALEAEIHSQHNSFLDKVKNAIYAHPDILVNMDPHIL